MNLLCVSLILLLPTLSEAQIIQHQTGSTKTNKVATSSLNYYQATDPQTNRTLCALDAPTLVQSSSGDHGLCLMLCANRASCRAYNYHWNTSQCDIFDDMPATFALDTVCINYLPINFQIPFPMYFVAGYSSTMLQQRVDTSTFFNRNWANFQSGFGISLGNFWLGNDRINNLTSKGGCRLHVNLQSANDNQWYWVEYNQFTVGPPSTNYTLTISGQTGNVVGTQNLLYNNGVQFSTLDVDNDIWVGTNCAAVTYGGFWYKACCYSCLNSATNGQQPFKWNATINLLATQMVALCPL